MEPTMTSPRVRTLEGAAWRRPRFRKPGLHPSATLCAPRRSRRILKSVLWGALVVATVTAPTTVRGQDGRYFQFATTQSYLAATEDLRNGYVAGLLDTIIALGPVQSPIPGCIETMRLQDIRADFDLWLRNHPVEWRYSLPTNFLIAIRGFCE